MIQRLSNGFSTVELLITIFVAAMFVLIGYQLYGIITHDNQGTSDLSIASNSARTYGQQLIQSKSLISGFDCGIIAGLGTIQENNIAYGSYPTNLSITYACPSPTDLPNLRKINVTSTYRGASATHAFYFNV